jgi:hypothetical protein
MRTLRFKQGEIVPISFVLRDAAGNPIDLTNATSLTWTVRKPGQTPIIDAEALTRVAPYTSGKVSYTPDAAEVEKAGRYQAEAFVEFSGGQQRSYPNGANAEVIIEPTLRTLA